MHPEVSQHMEGIEVGDSFVRSPFGEGDEAVPKRYLRKGLGYAQWSGSPLLFPGELVPPLAPKGDTLEFGTDTSSAFEHPLCSSTGGSTWSRHMGQEG